VVFVDSEIYNHILEHSKNQLMICCSSSVQREGFLGVFLVFLQWFALDKETETWGI